MKTEELFELAKEDLLKDGEHPPVMYVEYTLDGKEHLDYYYFAEFGAETPTEERMQFFALGAKWGQEHPGQIEFTQLTFVSEAWMSSVKPGSKPGFRRPADDPNRKEALAAQIVTLQPTPDGKQDMKQTFLRAEIIRPAKGVVDLVPVDNSGIQVTRLLFPGYFLAGYSASQRTPEELAQMFHDAIKGDRGE